MCIHFRDLGVGLPRGHGGALEFLGDMAFELTAVIGEHGLDAIGEDRLDEPEELTGSEARVATRGPSEREVRMQLGERDDEATAIIGLPLDGIERHTVPGMTGDEMLGFA